MGTSFGVDTYMKEHEATLLKNSLDSLYILRNSLAPMSAEDDQQITDAIRAIVALRDYLTRAHELPRYVDAAGESRRWEHPSI